MLEGRGLGMGVLEGQASPPSLRACSSPKAGCSHFSLASFLHPSYQGAPSLSGILLERAWVQLPIR